VRLHEDFIDRTPEEGARLVALMLLAEADRAAKRFAGDEDREALHDFRVALRRLRTALRTFRAALDVGGKLEKRLKKLARATNAARDAEVQLGWLAAHPADSANEAPRRDFELLVGRFEARREEGSRSRARLATQYAKTSRKLSSRLSVYEARLDTAGGATPFSALLASLAEEHFDALERRLGAIQGADDQRNVHKARIQGKRLRYLLEPLKGHPHADARQAVAQLKALQDVLGTLHDVHVLANEVAATLVEAAGDSARRLYAEVYGGGSPDAAPSEASPRSGLLEVARLARQQRDELYHELRGPWHGEKLENLRREIVAVATALQARAGGRVEREHKFLLSAVPPETLSVASIEITQGWLPGDVLRERIRRVRAPDGEKYWRAVKSGTGPVRLETEEETAPEVFEALWPLTLGRRISKHRWKVSDGDLVWEIDRFLDRDLVLAEVELPASAADAPLPEWLKPFVVREVTGDVAYSNANLALARDGAVERGSPSGDAGVQGTAAGDVTGSAEDHPR
jgi:CHAD domain-containing protein/CYTH domain-containing protein